MKFYFNLTCEKPYEVDNVVIMNHFLGELIKVCEYRYSKLTFYFFFLKSKQISINYELIVTVKIMFSA